jgi:hypothetical protein
MGREVKGCEKATPGRGHDGFRQRAELLLRFYIRVNDILTCPHAEIRESRRGLQRPRRLPGRMAWTVAAYCPETRKTSHAQRPTCAPRASLTFAR